MAPFDRCREPFATGGYHQHRDEETMSGKRVKCRVSDWMLGDENIENVERVSLAPEVQRELGCSVGEHVFLEYPWAYVPREAVTKHLDALLEQHREKIQTYDTDTFLVGYASARLIGRDFVICLTEKARSTIARRNADISRRIRREVMLKVGKTGGAWKSLGSETTLDESLVRDAREFYEVEVRLPIDSLNLDRKLSDRSSEDSRDSYVELLPYEIFENVEMKRISRMIQTHLEPREIQAQTYPGHPKSAWTQYVYADTTLKGGNGNDNAEEEEKERESAEEKSEREESEGKRKEEEVEGGSKETSEIEDAEQRERGPLELFLEERAGEMIDAVRYNTVVNLHVDDVETLARPERFEVAPTENDEIVYAERFSLVDLRFATGKVVSDASWHPSRLDCVAVSYVTRSCTRNEDGVVSRNAATATALLWSLADSLRPRLLLLCHQEIYCVSFCPTNGDFVIGGTASGQVVVWNVHGRVAVDVLREDELDSRSDRRTVSASARSDRDRSHELPIRRIQWLPDNYRIEPSGKLTKLSTPSSCQFVTLAEDGTVAFWDLLRYSVTSQLKPSDRHGDLDDTLRPVYRLRVRPSKDSSSSFTPLCLCLPSIGVYREDDEHRRGDHHHHVGSDPADADYTKRLWIGTAQGELACCTWQGQIFDAETSELLEECEPSLGRSCGVHDGPVTAILRSPHLRDVLLTTGGRVFAIWKDDYLESPLFRRKSGRAYTACCWSNRPGIFLMGTGLGDLEVWDVRRRSSEPVLVQTISGDPITLLSLRESACEGDLKVIGAGDRGSAFRVFKEPADHHEESTLERLDWFEEYVWREVRRKRMFSTWQKDFLQNDAAAVAKRQARTNDERRKRLERARLQLHKQHEERLRLEAEEAMRKVPKSKDTVWKLREQGRMRKVLLKKKRFAPRELEEKRLPLVRLAEERSLKITKARNEAQLPDKYLDNFVSLEFPELYGLEEGDEVAKREREAMQREEMIDDMYLREFYKIRDEARKIMAEESHRTPKFDWNTCAKRGKERVQRI